MTRAKKDQYCNVVVVGAEIGGIMAALKLSKNKKCSVTLVAETDQIYLKMTSAGNSRTASPVPLSKIFAGRNVRLVHDTIVGLDRSRKLLVGASRQYQYDVVIFALGVQTDYFGIAGLREATWSAATHADEQQLRKHLHDVSVTKHVDKNYFVIGGGPTGVELAASLKEYVTRIGAAHNSRDCTPTITLVEAAPRLLPHMNERSSRRALAKLQALGVDVLLKTTAKKRDGETLLIGGREIPLQKTVWASGLTSHPFFTEHPDIFRCNTRGFVTTNEYLEASRNVFVVGDNIATRHTRNARAAIHDGKYVAKVISQRLSGMPPPLYMPKRGFTIVSLGNHWAVYERASTGLTGKSASLFGKISHFMISSTVLPISDVLRIGFVTPKQAEFECQLCQKNNDSSSVASSS